MRDQAWRLKAACLNHPCPDWWHPKPKDTLARAAAQKVCAECPVTAECRAEAIRTGSEGIWGGQEFERPKQEHEGRPLAPIEHGTERGYAQHRRRGESACDACRDAANYASRYRRYGLDTR